MNHVGHFIGAFAKGLWGARKHIEIELTPGSGRKWGDQLRDEADEIGIQREIQKYSLLRDATEDQAKKAAYTKEILLLKHSLGFGPTEPYFDRAAMNTY